MTPRSAWAVALSLVAIYFLVSLPHLDAFPVMHHDEPWIASGAAKLANEGVYGTDLFSGFWGMERHIYVYMPVYSLLQAVVFWVCGVGIWQMRLTPVLCGAIVLLLAFATGSQLKDRRVGLLAMALLLTLRVAAGQDESGIPLLDLARVNRYDIAVPIFGLAAMWMLHVTEATARKGACLLATGMLLGLASLTHLYGLFWVPAVGLVLLESHGRHLWRQRAPYTIAFGFFLAVLPWTIYVLTGWTDYVGQRIAYAGRFDLLSMRFYLTNVLSEVTRYRPFLPVDRAGEWNPWQLGTWVVALGLPATLMHIRRRERGPIRTVAAMLIVPAVLYALLLSNKQYSYLIALWPFAVLVMAWAGVRLWDQRRTSRARWALAGLLLVLVVEGGFRLAHRQIQAGETTPYLSFERRVAEHIPAGSRVLGLHGHWLGLSEYPFTSWWAVLNMADADRYHAEVSLAQAMERAAPDVILMDDNMRTVFDRAARPTAARHEQYLSYLEFLRAHEVELAATVEDPTYGTMRILRVPRDNR